MTRQHFNGRPIPQSIAIVAMGFSRLDYGTHATSVGGHRAVADEIWAINKMGGVIFHDIMWRMDDLRIDTKLMYPEYERWLKTHPLIVTSTAYPEFPGSIEFPLEEVLRDIGIPYLNTTPAYALAYAIYLGIKKILIYGCDFTYPEQAMCERGQGCFEMLMGIAFQRKIELNLGPHAALLDTSTPVNKRFYGYHNIDVSIVNGLWNIKRTSVPEKDEVSTSEVLNDN